MESKRSLFFRFEIEPQEFEIVSVVLIDYDSVKRFGYGGCNCKFSLAECEQDIM